MLVSRDPGALVERFLNETAVKVSRVFIFIAAVACAAAGIAVLSNASGSSHPSLLLAIGLLILTGSAALAKWGLSVRPIVIQCYPDGFSVTGLPGRREEIVSHWADVTSVLLALTEGGPKSPKLPYIEVEAIAGKLFGPKASQIVSEKLVERFNMMTPHLPYTWEKKKSPWSLLIWEKVPRRVASA